MFNYTLIPNKAFCFLLTRINVIIGITSVRIGIIHSIFSQKVKLHQFLHAWCIVSETKGETQAERHRNDMKKVNNGF